MRSSLKLNELETSIQELRDDRRMPKPITSAAARPPAVPTTFGEMSKKWQEILAPYTKEALYQSSRERNCHIHNFFLWNTSVKSTLWQQVSIPYINIHIILN